MGTYIWFLCDLLESRLLESSFLFFEAQRSGKLPADQRVKWVKKKHECAFSLFCNWTTPIDTLSLNTLNPSRLPQSHQRNDSALLDGKDAGQDLSGVS